MKNYRSFNSLHFDLQVISDGVYACIHKLGGCAICNAGIIDLGDRTIVFDAFESPIAAMDLRNCVEQLTGRPVHAVINSHYHDDHTWGNQAFSSETDIISTIKTRALIASEAPKMIKDYRDNATTQLQALERQIRDSATGTVLIDLQLNLGFYQGIVDALPLIQIRLPNITFNNDVTIIGSKRSVKLIEYNSGHSKNDVVLHLPDDGIIFMGDLLFIGYHPYLADGDPDHLKHILAQVRQLQAVTFVSGHGGVGTSESLDWIDEYIETVRSLVRDSIKNGVDESEIDRISMPEKYHSLLCASFFPANLKFLFNRLTKN